MLLHVVYLLLFAFFVKLSSAQDIPCSVTQDDKLTRYSVPDFTATDCLYSWANASHHVLANQEESVDELVKIKTDRTLVTSWCLTVVHYKRDCISEKMQRTWTCYTNCTGGPESLSEGGSDKPKLEIYRSHWIALVVIAVMLLVLLGCLWYWICTSLKRSHSLHSMDDGESGESGESWQEDNCLYTFHKCC